MRSKWLRLLWWFTGLTALLLLVVTVALFMRAGQIEEETGVLAYIAQSQSGAFLRERPSDDGPVLTIVEAGRPVRIGDSTTRGNVDWYFVDAGELSGWLEAASVTFDKPPAGG